ncbi:YeeE/YedE family protein [Pontibaca salina]|uniref:YeeE/YedE family protein n=1 Tax=Pontibaca salina TaxID=2795731 RepID=A0A934HT52_9RHOB|nr:YeeE/YedE family protein [Pontibaca salina]MBI6630060.1 YeeE/YedE family protein [Pontibaca salina]
MIEILGEPLVVALIGLLSGGLLGLAARLGGFCTLGALEDYFYSSSDLRLRMWGVAIGVAILGTFSLIWAGWLDASGPAYLAQGWNPWAAVLGGLVFGYGTAISGNCGFGALARLGGGDLRSFVIVLVTGIAAYVALSGPLAELRVWMFPLSDGDALPGLAHALSRMTGLAPAPLGFAIGLLVLTLVVAPRHVRRSGSTLFWGAVVGLAITAGWAGTAWVAREGWEAVPIVSHTFSAPLGDTILYAMLASGLAPSFGVGSVLGVLAGAFVGSLIKGHFRWEACDDPRELRRQIGGAVLMGFGAVVAAGCSVGQGLSAMSLLAFSAPLTLVSIFVGAYIGLRQLIVGFASAE